jgi:hypothetical protein
MRPHATRHPLLPAALCFAACLPSALATPVIVASTFGPGNAFTSNSSFGLGSLGGGCCGSEWANSFTPSASYTLDSISVAVGYAGGPDQFSVYLASGLSQPGSPIESFILTGLTPSNTLETVTSSLSPTLFAGTQYWIVVSATDAIDTWGTWAQGLLPIPGGLFAGDHLGSSWETVSGDLSAGGAFSVVGTHITPTTPEPGTNALCLLGGLCFFGLVTSRRVNC